MRHLTLACLLPILFFLAPTTAGRQASQPDQIFVPGDYVPLSEYAQKTGNSITLHVNPAILSWITATYGGLGNLRMAVRDPNGTIFYLKVSANQSTGQVTLMNLLARGPCVVISRRLTQTTDIVTHWSQPDPNLSRGQQITGAKDVLAASLEFNPTANAIENQPTQAYEDAKGAAQAAGWEYPTDKYALFSDESGVHDDAMVPAFERYVAETFALTKPTALACVALSDQIREATGYPAAHRNPDSPLVDGLPFFQFVHARIVDIDVDAQGTISEVYPNVPGKENSLATIVLPPDWSNQSNEGPYPLMMRGMYDVHITTFLGQGLEFATAIATVHDTTFDPDDENRVIGILWNSGGVAGTGGFHRSLYDNAARLIDDVANLYGGNRDLILCTGGSRGGTTALEIAAKPYGASAYGDYHVQYVHASAVQVRLGEAVEHFSNASFELAHVSLAHATGDHFAWKGDCPDTSETTLATILGTTGPSTFEDANDLSLNSEALVSALAVPPFTGQETRILLGVTTQDHVISAYQSVAYVDALRNNGIRVQTEFYYRSGHNFAEYLVGDAELLDMMIRGVSTLVDRDLHLSSRATSGASYSEVPVTYVPLSLDTALAVGEWDPFTWTFTGEPGGRVRLVLTSVGAPSQSHTLEGILEPTRDFNGATGLFGRLVFKTALPTPSSGGSFQDWAYEVHYDPYDNGMWIVLDENDAAALISAPPGTPNAQLRVFKQEGPGYSPNAITGGLAEL